MCYGFFSFPRKGTRLQLPPPLSPQPHPSIVSFGSLFRSSRLLSFLPRPTLRSDEAAAATNFSPPPLPLRSLPRQGAAFAPRVHHQRRWISIATWCECRKQIRRIKFYPVDVNNKGGSSSYLARYAHRGGPSILRWIPSLPSPTLGARAP